VNYTGATATVHLNVLPATPTITWTNPRISSRPRTANDSTANVAELFAYTPVAGTVLGAATNQALQVTFTPTDAVNYTGATATVHLNVLPATPDHHVGQPRRYRLRDRAQQHATECDSERRGTFAYTPAAGTVLGAATKPGAAGHVHAG